MSTFLPHVLEALAEVLQTQDTRNWTSDTRLEADLGMDSGLMLELIMQLEEGVPGLIIDQATLSYEQFATIGSVSHFVETNRSAETVL